MTTQRSMWEHCMLEGAELDAAVAKLLGLAPNIETPPGFRDGKIAVIYTGAPDYGPLFRGEKGHGATRWSPSTDWAQGGPLIERDQIFLDPPHDTHAHGGPNAGWHRTHGWSATVSARTRRYPNHADPALPGCVGRGAGPTPLIAAMRAFVASFGVGA